MKIVNATDHALCVGYDGPGDLHVSGSGTVEGGFPLVPGDEVEIPSEALTLHIRARPDDLKYTKNGHDVQFKMFTCSYRYDGKEWSVDFPATSFADAEARLSALHFGRVDGILRGTIPAYPGVGVYVRVMTWLRNAFRG